MKCIGVLWNSMNDYIDVAISDISEEANVLDVINLDLNDLFEEFVRDIYGYDTPETQWKIDYKIENSIGFYDSRMIHIVFMEIEVSDMEYIERKDEYVPKSINSLKKRIRNKYSKVVPHYAFDNVFHMTESDEEYKKTLTLLRSYAEKLENNSLGDVKTLSLGSRYEK